MREEVKALFIELLGREPSTLELDQWVTAAEMKGGVEEIRSDLEASVSVNREKMTERGLEKP